MCFYVDFLDSCRANTLLAELDDEEDLPEPDDDDDENEDDNQEDQEYEEVLVILFLFFFCGMNKISLGREYLEVRSENVMCVICPLPAGGGRV